MNLYIEMLKSYRKTYNEAAAGKIFVASNDDQLQKGYEAIGLLPGETVVKLAGNAYGRAEDVQKLNELTEQFNEQLREAMAADQTGEGFIKDMFCTELEIFGYRKNKKLVTLALEFLHITAEDLEQPNISHGLELAKKLIK